MTRQENWFQWLTQLNALLFDGAETRSGETFTVKLRRLDELKRWRYDGESYRRNDQRFFKLVGVEIEAHRAGREVSTWHQPLLKEDGEGVCLLACSERYVLLQAACEPGWDKLLLRPTLTASRANLEQAHGGKKPPRAELFDLYDEAQCTSVVQDASRFLGKQNSYGLVDVERETMEPLGDYERWFSLEELKQAMRLGACNQHLHICASFLV